MSKLQTYDFISLFTFYINPFLSLIDRNTILELNARRGSQHKHITKMQHVCVAPPSQDILNINPQTALALPA